MKLKIFLGLFAIITAIALLLSIRLEFEQNKEDVRRQQPFILEESPWPASLQGLPRGIVEPTSDLELKPLWQSSSFDSKETNRKYSTLLAMAVGISQKENVDSTVTKFLLENCSIILFHYDGNVDGWHDVEWNDKAIHIVAQNQTKWWFAKRFLHPDVVSIYDYIFLWDEDVGVENFNLARYLQIMSSEGLEITQPALDPHLSSDIHHRITIWNRMTKVHRRVYDNRGNLRCSEESTGPPCIGWVEGMAPVFSRAAWQCVWHLIQVWSVYYFGTLYHSYPILSPLGKGASRSAKNDLVHGWGLDMKVGYCAQGDRTKKVGVIDTEFIVHKGIPTLGGSSYNKVTNQRSLDLRTQISRQSTAEFKIFKARWNKAVSEDKEWPDSDFFVRKKGDI